MVDELAARRRARAARDMQLLHRLVEATDSIVDIVSPPPRTPRDWWRRRQMRRRVRERRCAACGTSRPGGLLCATCAQLDAEQLATVLEVAAHG